MEDDLDPDTYGDDFSESGQYTSLDQEDDEQHTQKVYQPQLHLRVFFAIVEIYSQ